MKLWTNAIAGKEAANKTVFYRRGGYDVGAPRTWFVYTIMYGKVIDSSLHEVRYACLRSGIEIKKKYGATRSHLGLDINQMIQVLVNLLLNAIDAMSTGGVITINTLSDETEVEVRIEDEGKGIAKEHLQRIFDPFFSTRTQGIGLGLAIASRILLQHKGRISVQSKVGVGTKFIIRLPLELSGDQVNG